MIKKNVNDINKKFVGEQYNYGLAILRIIMTFMVVLCHFWEVDNYSALPFFLKLFYYLRNIAVPVFMVMSFYLLEKHVTEEGLLKRRLSRLVVPYVAWAIAYFIVVYFTKLEGEISLDALFWQLALGSSRYLSPQLWYQWVLIILTVFVIGLFKIYSVDKAYLILSALTVIACVVQYSGINGLMFGGFEYEQRWTLGRVAEMFPYMMIGLTVSRYNIIEKFTNNKLKKSLSFGMFSIILLGIIKIIGISSPVVSFGYGGLKYLIIAVCAVILFLIIPLRVQWGGVVVLSKYSFGVYCLHILIGKELNLLLREKGLPYNTFFECICIFLICYLISFCMDKAHLQILKKMVS